MVVASDLASREPDRERCEESERNGLCPTINAQVTPVTRLVLLDETSNCPSNVNNFIDMMQ